MKDDGQGIKATEFDIIAKRGTTSKIKEFDDIYAIKTLGFRGEALAALCNLSTVSISTKVQDEDSGFVVKFDKEGNVISKEKKPLKKGTTVSVRDLFKNNPPRQKEFLKTYSTHYSRCVAML